MIIYTGLVFFAVTYLPAARDALYGTSAAQRQEFAKELRGPARSDQPVTAPNVSLPALAQRLESEWGAGHVASMQIIHPAGESPYIDVRRASTSTLSVHELAARFSAIDGERLPLPEAAPATMRVRSTLFALHEGLFADWWLRWLYVISGLLGCAVIGTGLVLWTVKRGQQHQRLQPFAVQTVYRHSSHVS